jgi:hypothetical protein
MFISFRIIVNAARLKFKDFYTTVADEACETLFVASLLFIFRLRKPEEVRLVVLADGQIGLAPPVVITMESRREIEMVSQYHNIRWGFHLRKP